MQLPQKGNTAGDRRPQFQPLEWKEASYQMMVSTANVFKWKCFVSAKQMFAFWPVGTNQQMLLLTFPQADWHRTLPSVRSPFSQELSHDATGGLVEAFCESNHLVKRPQALLKQSPCPRRSSGLGVVLQLFLNTWVSPQGLVCQPGCSPIYREIAYAELTAHRVALIFHRSLCPQRAVVCQGPAQGQGDHLVSVFIYVCVFV